MVARLAANAALWVRIQTSLKNIQNGRHRKRSGQHTLAREKKKNCCLIKIFLSFIVSVAGTSLWGPKKVGSLRYSAMTVLPIYVHALNTGHQLVMHEVALQMESLVLRQVPRFSFFRHNFLRMFFLFHCVCVLYFTVFVKARVPGPDIDF